ncbi:adhesion G protein-coupled receptor L2-like isoform X4 [Branchiostoma floridae x Branchiostoma japonicum]
METPRLPAKLLLSTFVLLLMGLSLGNETVHPIGFPTATNREIACEGLVINLRCPSHRVIFIEGANYGRTDNLTCARNPRRMRNTNCRHPDSLKIMSDRCNNRTQCVVPALDGVFGEDPCPDTYKYLEVFFRCVSSFFECPGTLESVGRPETLTQMGTKIGSWYRDPVPGVDKGKIYVMPWRPFNTISVDEYADIDDLKDLKPSRTIPLPDKVDGTGFVVYDGAAYYNKERSPSIIKFNLSTLNRDLQKELPGARYHNEAPYRFGGMSDIDLAVDENGLWAIYATEESEGRMVIAKLDPDSLAVEKTWETNYNKRAATNTFMVCGKLYVVSTRYVQPVDTGGKLVYVYDTSTGDGENLNLPFYNQYGYNTQVDYNPRDNSLHVWDNGYLLSYPLTFEAVPTEPPPSRPVSPDVPTVNPDKEGLVTTPAPRLQPTTQNRPEPPQRPVSTRRPPARPATTTAAPVGPQRPDTVTARPSPKPTAPVSTTTEETPAFLQQFCPPMFARNISWPRTPAGEVSKQPCPPGTDGGVATWRCGRNPVQWSTATPDLTDCTSRWVAGINRKIRDGESALDIAQDLVGKITESREIYGGDVKKAVKIMDQLVVLVTSQVQNMEPQDKQESLNTFTQTLVEAGSMLLDEDRVESWEDMSAGEQSISATTLVKTVEENGLLLAEHLPPRRKVTATDNNIAMEVLVVDTTGEVEDMSFPPEGNAISDVITLPGPSIKAHGRNGTAKVVFVTYSTLGRFLSSNSPTHGDINFVDSSERMLGTRVIAASINRLEQQQLLPEPVVFTLEHTQENVSGPLCSFWKYEPLVLIGYWSGEGCSVVATNTTHTSCSCNHLTNFAVLMDTRGVKLASTHVVFLSAITWVGMIISICCLFCALICFSIFRGLKSDRNTIHKNLCFNLIIAELFFLIGIDKTQYQVACPVFAAILHFFFLASFAWMCLEGFQLYVMVIEVFESQYSRLKYYYLFGYGVPLVVVGVSAAIDHRSYGTDKYCWLQLDNYFIWSFVGPVCLILLLNVVFLTIAMYKMYVHITHKPDQTRTNTLNDSIESELDNATQESNFLSWLKGSAVLLCLLGLTWAFGLLYINAESVVMAYAFTITNAFQGVFIFIFHCLMQKKVQKEFKRFVRRSRWCPVCIKQRMGVHSEAYNMSKNSTSRSSSTPQRFSRWWSVVRTFHKKSNSSFSTSLDRGQIVMYHNVKNKDGSLSNGTIETSESNGQMPANMVPNFHANPYHADSYCEDFSISDTNFYHIGNGGDPTGKVVIPCLVDANIGRPPDVNGKKSLGGAPIEEEDLHEREKTPLLQRHSVVSDSSREDSDESSTRAPLVPDMQDGNKKDQTTHHRSMPNLDSHPEKGERPPGDGASNLDGQHFQSTPNLSPAKQPQHQRQSVLMRGTSDGIVNTASRCYRYSTDSEISFGPMKDQDVHTDPEFGGDTAIPPHPDFSEC